MAQIFHPSMNTLSRASLAIVVSIPLIAAVASLAVERSPYRTRVGVVRDQPVPFSHRHHVRGLGIDCRYCHWSVEQSSFAGIPSTEICMNCHTHVWAESDMLEPVRASYREGFPLPWVRVHDVPDYAFFDHSIHVASGVDCSVCHGAVDDMPLMMRTETLHMQWCVACHRDPLPSLTDENCLRPGWRSASSPIEEATIEIRPAPTHCSTCHH